MHFINRFAKRSGKSIAITDEALDALRGRAWHGNVRELENTIERAVAFTPAGESITAEQCAEQLSANGAMRPHLPADGLHLPGYLNTIEKDYVEEALRRCNGNQTRAAELLRIPVHSFRHLLDKHELR
jgi:DNA-binding NtrC family response regulator